MTIVKAIAIAALTGALAFAPQAAFANSQKGSQSGEHGNSAAAKADKATKGDARAAAKADKADQDAGDTDDGGEDGDTSGNSEAGVIKALQEAGLTDAQTTMANASAADADVQAALANIANNLLKEIRTLMGWAIANKWRTDDPTIRIKKFKEGTHHT